MEETAEQVASVHSLSVILAQDGRLARRIWRLQHQCPVGTVAVVMLDVGPKDLLQVATANDQGQSRHPARTVRTQRSAYALALALAPESPDLATL